jgi:large subunit ribosomal protein L17
MRHRKAGKKLGRSRDQRRALFKNLINALIIHGRIETTEAKAKAVKGLVDKVINKAKQGTLHSRRLLLGFLGSQEVVKKAVEDLAPQFKRVSGFTRIVKLGSRRGDNASMVRIELVKPDAEFSSSTPKSPSRKTKKVAKAKEPKKEKGA